MDVLIREANNDDLEQILKLYTHLHNNEMPFIDDTILNIWKLMINDKNYHIIVALANDIIVSSCVLVVIPNLTHFQKPYALIENVITHKEFRNKGIATQVLSYAKEIAVGENCYKIMLLTGSKEETTLGFYKKSGYNCVDKTGFIHWL